MIVSKRKITATLLAAFVAAGLAGAWPQPAAAADLGRGALPLKVDAVVPLSLGPSDEIHVEGVIEGSGNVVVVLRIDDLQSWSYASRFNGERTLPPGPFRWTIGAGGLKTSSGRYLDHTALRRMVLFQAAGSAAVRVTRFETAPQRQLPGGAKGYALGAREAELPAGFTRIAPGDPSLSGRNITAITRPAPDPLVASGLRGLDRLTLPWPRGRARVTLWSEDPGAWELLPHPLARRIRVNGIDVRSERSTPRDWIATRYLRGAGVEHAATDDAWTAYGRLRGEPYSTLVDVGDGGVVVELAGDGAEALFLNAVLIEPAESTTARDAVEAARADWYRATWPVVPLERPARRAPHAIALPAAGQAFTPPTISALVARGTGTRVTVAVSSPETMARPRITLEPPRLAGTDLHARLWAAEMRLERRHANDTTLSLDDNTLVGDTSRLPIAAAARRTYELWISAPEQTPAGHYRGHLVIVDAGGQERRVALDIDVPDLALPPVGKPAGYYLDEAPHLTWFAATTEDRARQLACDLAFMTSMGLDGGAPALATPKPAAGRFEDDMQRAHDARVAAPWLAYAPAKRLLAASGIEGSARELARIDRTLSVSGLVPPVWSVADEPSNPDHPQQALREWIAAIRRADPSARLAGHLNAAADRALAPLFDVVLVNDGYGLDLPRIADAAGAAGEAWLYNTAHPRVSAGLWLWKSAARRYVQWHARMPTADPFDPTDGREGDVQTLLPEAETCPALPSIHRDLLEMAEGIVDQRWMLWMEAQASHKARELLRHLRHDLAPDWRRAAALSPADLDGMRESLIELYRQQR